MLESRDRFVGEDKKRILPDGDTKFTELPLPDVTVSESTRAVPWSC